MSFWNGTGWVQESAPASQTRRGPGVLTSTTRAGLITLLILGLAAGGVSAAPGGKGGKGGGNASTSSLALVLMDGATDARHGGRVTFDVSTTATDRPFVGVRCWQGSNWVLDGYTGFFATYMFDPWVTLDSPYWTAGENATCTARLFYYDRRGNQKVLKTLDFPALP